MNYLSTDHLIVYAFLLITLAIGLWAGRGIKDIREYAIANKQFGTGALVLTWLATDIGGESIINIAGEVGQTGIIISLALLGGTVAFIMQAVFVAPRVAYFDGCITMGDIMGTLYGTNGKLISGVAGFFTAICIAGMEMTVLGILCESSLGIDYRYGLGIGGSLLALYSSHGGIKAVTVTDVFQFLILSIVIPVIAIIALKHAGGITSVFTSVPAEKLQVVNHVDFSQYLALFISLSIFNFGVLDPALIQRLLMGKNQSQLRNQLFIVACFFPAFQITIMLIGLAAFKLYPTLDGTEVVPQILNNLLPTGIKGLAIAGLLAVTISTIDSFLHATGLTLVHDVIKPFCDKKDIVIDELTWTKYATFLIGLIAIAIGFTRADDLYGFVLASFQFVGPLLTFPFWCGIMGLKPDQRAFYTAAGVTTTVLILAKFLAPESQSHWVPIISVITNGIVFLGMHAVR
ncbi:MAG: sodium:solute symporter family protein, partial [Bacteroidota bacterium]